MRQEPPVHALWLPALLRLLLQAGPAGARHACTLSKQPCCSAIGIVALMLTRQHGMQARWHGRAREASAEGEAALEEMDLEMQELDGVTDAEGEADNNAEEGDTDEEVITEGWVDEEELLDLHPETAPEEDALGLLEAAHAEGGGDEDAEEGDEEGEEVDGAGEGWGQLQREKCEEARRAAAASGLEYDRSFFGEDPCPDESSGDDDTTGVDAAAEREGLAQAVQQAARGLVRGNDHLEQGDRDREAQAGAAPGPGTRQAAAKEARAAAAAQRMGNRSVPGQVRVAVQAPVLAPEAAAPGTGLQQEQGPAAEAPVVEAAVMVQGRVTEGTALATGADEDGTMSSASSGSGDLDEGSTAVGYRGGAHISALAGPLAGTEAGVSQEGGGVMDAGREQVAALSGNNASVDGVSAAEQQSVAALDVQQQVVDVAGATEQVTPLHGSQWARSSD